MTDGTYKGVPLSDLRIEDIQWSEEAIEHVRSRPLRQPGASAVEPEWATEAALAEDRVVQLAASASVATASLKVIGTSWSAPGAPVLLKVWLWSDDPSSTTWQAGSASFANDSDVRRHERRNG